MQQYECITTIYLETQYIYIYMTLDFKVRKKELSLPGFQKIYQINIGKIYFSKKSIFRVLHKPTKRFENSH